MRNGEKGAQIFKYFMLHSKSAFIRKRILFGSPVLLPGGLWSFGLDGIRFNFVGVNALNAALSLLLLFSLVREIRKKEIQ